MPRGSAKAIRRIHRGRHNSAMIPHEDDVVYHENPTSTTSIQDKANPNGLSLDPHDSSDTKQHVIEDEKVADEKDQSNKNHNTSDEEEEEDMWTPLKTECFFSVLLILIMTFLPFNIQSKMGLYSLQSQAYLVNVGQLYQHESYEEAVVAAEEGLLSSSTSAQTRVSPASSFSLSASSSTSHHYFGMSLLGANRVEEASTQLQVALELETNAALRVALMVQLGEIDMNRGRFKSSMNWYAKALRTQEREFSHQLDLLGELHFIMGKAFQQMRQVEKAYEHFNFSFQLLTREDIRAEAMLLGGMCIQQMGLVDLALEAYLEALVVSHAPDFPPVLQVLPSFSSVSSATLGSSPKQLMTQSTTCKSILLMLFGYAVRTLSCSLFVTLSNLWRLSYVGICDFTIVL